MQYFLSTFYLELFIFLSIQQLLASCKDVLYIVTQKYVLVTLIITAMIGGFWESYTWHL